MPNEIISKENELVAVESTSKDYGSIRTILINGETWLCGLDACKVLGYTDITKTIKYHVKEADREKFQVRFGSQRREMVFINSKGFYDLCQGSKLETADQIKEWIKSTFFVAVEKNNLPVTVDALAVNEKFIDKVADRVVDVIASEAMKYRELKGSKSLFYMKDIADYLAIPGLGRNKLFEVLRAKQILNEENAPYRIYVDRGWFKRLSSEFTNEKGTHIKFVTKVTVIGLENIKRLLKEWGYC